MKGMLPIKGAILIKFQLFLDIPPIFLSGIIFPLTLGALQRNKFHCGLF
jgi:hypothetical protein